MLRLIGFLWHRLYSLAHTLGEPLLLSRSGSRGRGSSRSSVGRACRGPQTPDLRYSTPWRPACQTGPASNPGDFLPEARCRIPDRAVVESLLSRFRALLLTT